MIPVFAPWIAQNDLDYVSDCIRSGWISSSGRYNGLFEDRWASFCGRTYGIGVNSGTAALQIAVDALDFPPGSEIIMPTFTIISCAIAIIRAHCNPVLIDCDPETLCMDVNRIEEKITGKTRAIMPVHIYGHPVNMDKILDLAKKYELAVIEDAAEAHASEYLSRAMSPKATWTRCGAFGDLSCFSFYANKLITTGEGGMIVTDDARLAEKARSLRNLCFQPQRRFHHDAAGYSARFTNLQAALGLSQLDRIDQIIQRKNFIEQAYTNRLVRHPHVHCISSKPWARRTLWMFGIMLADDTAMDATRLAALLKSRGIETRPFFTGMHEQPALHKLGFFRDSHFPVAESATKKGLYLPSGCTLTEAQIDYICDALKACLKNVR